MKYISILLLWLVILAGTWTDMGQELFGPTQELREISKSKQMTFVSRAPNYVKNSENPSLVKAKEFLAKGELKDATIQYEAALSNKAWAQENPKKWAENMQTLLSITDPSLSYELISSFLGQGSIPENMREIAGLWRLHARDWANAQTQQSIDQSISEAKRLINQAEELEAKNRGPAGLVLYLRSAAILKIVLKAPDQDKNQEALLLAGRAAEGLKDRANFTEYYQRCVSIDPSSHNGQTCQQRQPSSRPLTANHLIEETSD